MCGLPSYLGAINTFLVYGAKLKGITLDHEGMNPAELEETIASLRGYGRKIKFIYIIPDFQNPSGITMSESRRLKIIEIAEKYDLLIIEDSPYREVRFEGESQRTMSELDQTGRVISLFTFSKILAPGFRVGWVVGNPILLDRIVMAKQTSDLCTSSFVQRIIARYIEKGLLEKNLQKTIELYRIRRDVMLESLRKNMPDTVKWTEPQGGLFLFVTLPEGFDADLIFHKSIEKNVAFVSGSTFFCNNSGKNTMRLNFSFSNNYEIEEGIRRLAEVIRIELNKH
jgi:2-aminoadipate transaminase